MLTDSDKLDIFILTQEMSHDANNLNYSRINLTSMAANRIIRFLMAHPDMCAAEFDDFLMNKKYALQEFRRLIGLNAESQ